jgi:hypothetical protein
VSGIAFSVVLGSTGSGRSLELAVKALDCSCSGLAAELIIVRAAASMACELPSNGFADVRVEELPAGTLTPVLWGVGATLARGRVIAFTTDQMRVTPTWARVLQGAIEEGTVGAGGPIILSPESDAATSAAFFTRFSAFTEAAWPAVTRAGDIPGDNAAYDRNAVMRQGDLLREGFWEVEFHRRFEREGLHLRMIPAAAAVLAGPVPFGGLVKQRFRHAMAFGVTRVRRHGASRARLLLSAPLVPLVLLRRMGRRAMATSQDRGRFLGILPRLSILAVAWAVGEAIGALLAGPGPVD